MNKDENDNSVLLTSDMYMTMTKATFWGHYNERFHAWLKLFNKKGASFHNANLN